jgi:hypothetical protein
MSAWRRQDGLADWPLVVTWLSCWVSWELQLWEVKSWYLRSGTVRKPRGRGTSAVGSHYQTTASEYWEKNDRRQILLRSVIHSVHTGSGPTLLKGTRGPPLRDLSWHPSPICPYCHVIVTIDGVRLVIGFMDLFDTARDYTLHFTITHVSAVTSLLAVAW